MSKRIATAVIILGAAGFISGCDITQPSAGCQVQDSDSYWQAWYIPKTDADAAKTCGKQVGEALGLWKYVKDPANPNTSSIMAIRPAGAAALTAYTTDDEDVILRVTNPNVATALSTSLAAEPDANGLCAAGGFNVATVDAAAVIIDEDVKEPETSVSYAFTDVQVYSAASAPGTQMKASLKYTDTSGCSANYDVYALWPQTDCDPVAFANPTPENAATRCGEGSGLNPDFDAVCVPGLGSKGKGGCAPNKKVPSFK